MFHRVHAYRAFADGRGALDRFEVLDLRINGWLILQIFTLKLNSMICRCGMQFQSDFVTCMQCRAAKTGSLTNGVLKFGSCGHSAFK